MTKTITDHLTTKSILRTVCALLIFLSTGYLPAAAQDHELGEKTLQGADEQTIVSAGIISSQTSKQFIVHDGAKVTLVSGRRIELNPGFKVLENGRLTAMISILEMSHEKGQRIFTAFPNPTTGVLNVTSVRNADAARLVDVTGIAVWEERRIGTTHFNLDISSVRPGIYILEIVSGKSVEKVRIEKK